MAQLVVVASVGDDSSFTQNVASECAVRLGLEVSILNSRMFPANPLPHISAILKDASIVLADVSHSDTFVIYAVSIAQCLGKKLVMVSTQIESVPFDVRSYRVEILREGSADNIDRLSNAMNDVLASDSIVGPLGGTIVYGQNLFLHRIYSFLLDSLPFAASALIWWNLAPESIVNALFFIGLAFYFYSSLCTHFLSQTLGQRFLRLKVIDINGERMKLGRAFGRELLAGMVFIMSYGFGFLWCLKKPAFRAIHDIATNSFVIRGSIIPKAHNNGNCLVIMPFQEDLKWHFDLFRKAGTLLGLEVSRVDTYAYSGNILQAIATGLAKADLIIADVTNTNLNVAYELSIAQCLRKRILYVGQNITPTSIDFPPHGVLTIDENSSQLVERIRDAMGVLLKSTYVSGPFGDDVVYGQRLFFRRIAAFFLDTIAMIILFTIIFSFLTILFSILALEIPIDLSGIYNNNSFWSTLLLILVILVLFVIYDSLTTIIKGATPGQLLLGLRVVTIRGEKVHFRQALWRSVLVGCLGSLYGIDFLWCLKGPAYSAFHDIFSRTMVVKR